MNDLNLAAPQEIRDLCDKSEPEVLWETLEAKGIETTPGMIHQLVAKAHDLDHKPEKAGLNADDLATLGALAAKAGGIDQLIRILHVWQK